MDLYPQVGQAAAVGAVRADSVPRAPSTRPTGPRPDAGTLARDRVQRDAREQEAAVRAVRPRAALDRRARPVALSSSRASSMHHRDRPAISRGSASRRRSRRSASRARPPRCGVAEPAPVTSARDALGVPHREDARVSGLGRRQGPCRDERAAAQRRPGVAVRPRPDGEREPAAVAQHAAGLRKRCPGSAISM